MGKPMTVVKIAVLETSLKKDLADEYAVPNLEPCPIMKARQVFYATRRDSLIVMDKIRAV